MRAVTDVDSLTIQGGRPLEGIVRELYPDLDFQEVIYPYVQKLLLQRFDPWFAYPHEDPLQLF